LILLLGLVLFAGASLILAEGGLFHPGSPIFHIQYFVEQRRADLTFNQNHKLVYLVDLVERRAGDVIGLAGTQTEVEAIFFLNENFNQALTALSKIPADELNTHFYRLEEMLGYLDAAMSSVSQAENLTSEMFLSLQEKISAMRTLLSMAGGADNEQAQLQGDPSFLPFLANGIAKPDATGLAAIPEHAVLFPPGSAGALHAFFPLTGQHAELTCESCHAGGRYAGTPATCESCHASVKPIPHFVGDCAACHTSNDWAEIYFDHTLAGTSDCQSCHAQDKPVNHFQGQCSACHNTQDWAQATFNHTAAGATNCQSCHSQNKPANHYTGQCSACHSTNAWRPANFNQSAQTDCQSCHADDRPANHFQGQCSSCHSTNTWGGADFNHEGFPDCQSCHNRPANHFQGQCSNCHSTNTWGGADFNHDGFTDCQSCHNRPDNHFQGQCSSCHSTNSWGGAYFSHDGFTDCQSCHNRPDNHAQGQCSNCHSTSSWEPTNFDHSGQTNCQSCHIPPSDHWSGQCSKCHNTNNWGNVSVDGHSFPMGHGDADGQCSSCHNGTNTNVNCFKCHDRDETVNKHREEGIEDIAGRCLECHPNGGGGDD
jgi:hypothetical protein